MASGFDNGSCAGSVYRNKTGQEVLDDGDVANLTEKLGSALSLSTAVTGVLDENGFMSIPVNISGVIKKVFIQWGSKYSENTSIVITYPQPYSIGIFFASATKITSGDGRFATVGNPSKNGVTAYGRLGNDPIALDNFMCFCIGV
ncbi:hypothetical protein [Serratia proteamaculans]|uniref:Phage tail protein n=1 Tax=Serratia proteamaculans TaxID=28151 RepID=A0ABS0TUE9_SERPR|nr:hypothetical protein [Serratia proteamaculans]KAB1498090.1 hypothetical protein F8R23_01115 [Serratia proteamaculans]MBI6180941.1 hypothetical protein [Serratia proteamaculans]RYM50865.1 hypothetical protein BSQ97_16050 [Serratia proteamaculans]